MLIEKLKKEFGYEEPIFANEILELLNEYTKAYVYRLIDEEIKKQKLVKYCQGVYYIPRNTEFGLSTITARDVAYKKYIKNSKEYNGFFSGLTLANEFNLTTQLPNKLEIVTNNEATRLREININGFTFILKKARVNINESNIYVYKLLELITENNVDNFSDESYEYIIKYIEKYKIKSSDVYAMLRYFPGKTSKRLVSMSIR